ncbi:MAG: tandem-95 repeat protein [Pseudomonadota bacterium]
MKPVANTVVCTSVRLKRAWSVLWACVSISLVAGASIQAALANNGAGTGGGDLWPTGYHNNTANCTSCHGTFNSLDSTTLNFTGDTTPDPGETHAYSVRLSSPSGSNSGVNAAFYELSGGSPTGSSLSGLTESDADVRIIGNEIVHQDPGTSGATYSFSWTPPTSLDVGDYRLFACMNDGNGNNLADAGDEVHCDTLNLTLNSDPVAVADDRTSVSILEDGGSVSITNVLGNDFSGSPVGAGSNRNDSGDNISITSDTDGTKGVVTRSGSTLFYNPNNDDSNGSDTFTYTITDSEGGTDVGTVTVNITPVEDPTELTQGGSGADITRNIDEDDDFSLTFNADDPDVANSTLQWSITNHTNPALGTPSIVGGSTGASKTIDYNTLADQNGQDTFTVRVQEPDNSSSNTIIVTVNVAPVSDAPVVTPAGPIAANMDEDGAPDAFTPINFSATDADTALADITWGIQSTTPAAAGTATVTSTGDNGSAATATLTFNPASNFNGAVTIVVRVGEGADGINNSETVTVNLTIDAINDAPTAANDQFAVADGSSNNQLDVLANDDDVDSGDTQEIISVTSASVGTVTIAPAADELLYTPPDPFTTNATFSYTFEDSGGLTASANVTVTPPDDDSDGVPNALDNCPDDANADQADFDEDAAGNACDDDDDNDGLTDVQEDAYDFLDPLNPDDAQEDFDGDGVSNIDEILNGDNPEVDDIAPILTVETPFSLTSSGFLTPITPDSVGVSAVDGRDGVITPIADMPGPFLPGRYTITWTATDLSDNEAMQMQQLDVVPMATVTPGQTIGEGGTANVLVTLSGDAPEYPVNIEYEVEELPNEAIDVGGSEDTADVVMPSGTLQIASGTMGVIAIDTIADTDFEGEEQVSITLISGDFAGIGAANTHLLRIVDNRNIAPAVTLSVDQAGNTGHAICQSRGAVTVTAAASDPNSTDALTLDWVGTDNALVPINASGQVGSATFEFDPAALADGAYRVQANVADDGSPSLSGSLDVYLSLAAGCLDDVNGDGIDDADEVPELAAPHLLQTRVGTAETTGVIQVDTGLSLRLGTTALSARRSGAEITATDIASFGENGAPPASSDDAEFDFIGGLFDFEIAGLGEGNRIARIVLPISTGLLPDSQYRLYVPGEGWRAFVEDANNQIHSAPLSSDTCPGPQSEDFRAGLNTFDRCVRLTVEDGGPNDSDGEANGVFRDPSGVAVARIEPQGDLFEPVSGGGGIGVLAVVVGTFIAWFHRLLFRRRQRDTKDQTADEK